MCSRVSPFRKLLVQMSLSLPVPQACGFSILGERACWTSPAVQVAQTPSTGARVGVVVFMTTGRCDEGRERRKHMLFGSLKLKMLLLAMYKLGRNFSQHIIIKILNI